MESFFVQKKTLIIEILILVALLGGAFYLYTSFTEEETITTSPTQYNEQILGKNSILFLKVVSQDNVSFQGVSSLSSKLVEGLKDHSETIEPTEERGRSDPFTPYASSRPLR